MSALLTERRIEIKQFAPYPGHNDTHLQVRAPHVISKRNNMSLPLHPEAKSISPEIQKATDWISQEVVNVKNKHTTNWWRGLNGFDTEDAVRQIRQSMSHVRPGTTDFEETVKTEASKLEKDMKAFVYEYLAQFPVLPIFLQKRDRYGKQEIIAPEYGDKEWSQTVGKQEREGVLYKALFEGNNANQPGIRDWLISAPKGSFALLLSPPGWSGYSVKGNEHTLQEAQLYAYHITDEGKLVAFTYRFTPTLAQCEDLQRKLGLHINAKPSEKEQIMQLVQNTALISGNTADKPISSFKDIVTLLKNVMQSDLLYHLEIDGKQFNHYSDEMLSYFDNTSKWGLHDQAPYLTAGLEEYTQKRLKEWNQNTQNGQLLEDLEIAMGVVALQLSKLYRVDEENSERRILHQRTVAQTNFFSIPKSDTNYEREKQELAKRPGCAGTNSEALKVLSTMRANNTSGTSEGETLECKCPQCHADVFAKIYDGYIHCPSCGGSAPYRC